MIINEILMANSHEEVIGLVDAFVKKVKEQQHNEFAEEFIVSSLNNLNNFSPMNKEAQQWSNIKTARIAFFRLQRQLFSIKE
ncbi:MAG: hypothetical protein KA160_00040 [Lacibacter sp.]|nr:hypothetical protein [Lacibacter sp.]